MWERQVYWTVTNLCGRWVFHQLCTHSIVVFIFTHVCWSCVRGGHFDELERREAECLLNNLDYWTVFTLFIVIGLLGYFLFWCYWLVASCLLLFKVSLEKIYHILNYSLTLSAFLSLIKALLHFWVEFKAWIHFWVKFKALLHFWVKFRALLHF